MYFWVQVFEYKLSIDSDMSECTGIVQSSDKVNIKPEYLNLNLVTKSNNNDTNTFDVGKQADVYVTNQLKESNIPYVLDSSNVEYTIDNPTIAKIENGKLTMLKSGVTTLRANVRGIEISKKISGIGTSTLKGDADENGKMILPSSEYKFTYIIHNNQIYIDFESDKATDSDYEYSFENNKLILKGIKATTGTYTFTKQ